MADYITEAKLSLPFIKKSSPEKPLSFAFGTVGDTTAVHISRKKGPKSTRAAFDKEAMATTKKKPVKVAVGSMYLDEAGDLVLDCLKKPPSGLKKTFTKHFKDNQARLLFEVKVRFGGQEIVSDEQLAAMADVDGDLPDWDAADDGLATSGQGAPQPLDETKAAPLGAEELAEMKAEFKDKAAELHAWWAKNWKGGAGKPLLAADVARIQAKVAEAERHWNGGKKGRYDLAVAAFGEAQALLDAGNSNFTAWDTGRTYLKWLQTEGVKDLSGAPTLREVIAVARDLDVQVKAKQNADPAEVRKLRARLETLVAKAKEEAGASRTKTEKAREEEARRIAAYEAEIEQVREAAVKEAEAKVRKRLESGENVAEDHAEPVTADAVGDLTRKRTRLDAYRKTVIALYDKEKAKLGIDALKASWLAEAKKKDPAIEAAHLDGLMSALDETDESFLRELLVESDEKRMGDVLFERVATLKLVIEQYQALIKDPAAVAEFVDSAVLAKEQAKLEARWREATGRVQEISDRLAEIDPAKAADMAKWFVRLTREVASGNLQKVLDDELPALEKAMGKAIDEARAETARLVAALRTRKAAVDKQIDKVNGVFTRPDTAKVVIKILTEELAQVQTALDLADSPDSAKAAADLLTRVEEVVKSTVERGEEGDFKRQYTLIQDIKKLLGEIGKFETATQAGQELKTRLDTLTADGAPSFDAYVALLEELLADAKATRTFHSSWSLFLKDARKRLAKAEGDVKALQNYLNKQGANFFAEVDGIEVGKFKNSRINLFGKDQYHGAMAEMVEELKDDLAVPYTPEEIYDQVTDWNEKFEILSQTVAFIWNGKAVKPQGKAKLAFDLMLGADIDGFTAQVKARHRAVTLEAKRLGPEIKKARGDMLEYKLKLKELENAKDKIAEDATEALKLIESLDKEIKKLPGTPAFEGELRGRLEALPDVWAKACGQMESQLGQLFGEVKAKTKDTAYQARIDPVRKSLMRLARTLDPDAFSMLPTIVRDDVPQRDRLAAREQGLATVRQYREFLTGDPMVAHVQSNPFGDGKIFTPVLEVLMDADLELRRCRI